MSTTLHTEMLGELSSLPSAITLPATYTINIFVKNAYLDGSQEWSNLYQQPSGYKYVLDAHYGRIGAGNWPSPQGRLELSASAALLVANQWHMVTARYDGTDMKYYVNGQPIGTVLASAGNWNAPSQINVLNGPSGQSFAELVKDLRLYEGVATDQEVLDSYSAGGEIGAAPPPPSYTLDMIAASTDAPSGEVGFEKGDEDAFHVSSDSSYSVYFYIAGAWDHHDGGLFSIGMTFAWPDGATRAYVQGSVAGQNVFKSVREIEDGFMYDTDDPDNVIDKFKTTGATFDVSEHQVTVSGTDDIVLGVASDFVQIIEGGALAHDYTVQVGVSTTVSPPEGKDGTALLIRIFKAES